MGYVIGVDLGTSAVKLIMVDIAGRIIHQASKSYPLIQSSLGYKEQDPDDWVIQTINGLVEIIQQFKGNIDDIEGISFSGQMHGLVLLDQKNEVLRPAILWNDTRTTKECHEVVNTLGQEKLLEITKNPALEGFTLPKLLWVKKYEPDIYKKTCKFILPKDYVRYKLTGKLQMEYSDAAGTLLLHADQKKWSREICEIFGVEEEICPSLIESTKMVGTITKEIAEITGLSPHTKVFAGGADNACGAIGAGILEEGKTLCSIGTSGVVLSYEPTGNKNFKGKVHYFNHCITDAFYTMGVTLAAGESLAWFKNAFANQETFVELLADIGNVPIGSRGLLFTPYLNGERTPYADSTIRGSFLGMDSSHNRNDFARAILEGITLSLNETIEIFRQNGKRIDKVISIGGGAQNEIWLQIQADVFNAKVARLANEQGPAMGAAMIAAHGCGWYSSLKDCASVFVAEGKEFLPVDENVIKYGKLFKVYQNVYKQTKNINDLLMDFR